MATTRAGLIGLGAMGAPMGRYVLEAGLELTCHDLDGSALEAMEARGAKLVETAAELAANADVILVVVPSDEDVRQVCMGADGLLAGATAGSVIVISSSVTQQTCEEIAVAAKEKGVGVLDAPLTGGIRAAEAGEITLLVGGDVSDLEIARPVLESFSRAMHVLGPLGSGQVGKTVNNIIHWGEIVVITEALALGAKLGVEVSALRQALTDCPVDGRTLRELELMKFTWHAKDLTNAFAMAEEVGEPLDVARMVAKEMHDITPQRVAQLLNNQGWETLDA